MKKWFASLVAGTVSTVVVFVVVASMLVSGMNPPYFVLWIALVAFFILGWGIFKWLQRKQD